jgi:glycerophosphoryl diester phosphodiesterase
MPAGRSFREVLQSRQFLRVAHRGASGYAPENTMEAFSLAIDQGADVIELDVHLTRDDEVVVLHDARVDRTTNGRGDVAALTAAEVASLDAGSWFGEPWRSARIPTLREVLTRFAGQAWIDIELKAGITMGFAEDPAVTIPLARRVLEVVEQAGTLERVVISGFAATALTWLRTTRPGMATQWAVVSTDITADAAFAARGGFDVISPQAYAASERNVTLAHEAGLAVHIYAGDSEETMARLITLGVDAVKTGRPDRLAAVLAALKPP